MKLIKDNKFLIDNDRFYITEDGQVYDSVKDCYVAQFVDGCGYKRCWINNNNYKIHRLVAKAFITYHFADTEKLTVNHKDENKFNNHVSNLAWNTFRENIQHAYRSGLSSARNRSGEKHFRARYSNEQIEIACRMLENDPDENVKVIADASGLKPVDVRDIRSYRAWADIAKDYDFIPRVDVMMHMYLIIAFVKGIRAGKYCNEILEKMHIEIKNGNSKLRPYFNFAKYKIIPALEKVGYYSIDFPPANLLKTIRLWMSSCQNILIPRKIWVFR